MPAGKRNHAAVSRNIFARCSSMAFPATRSTSVSSINCNSSLRCRAKSGIVFFIRFLPSDANCASIASCSCGQRLRRSVSSNWTAFSTCGATVWRSFASTSVWNSCCHCSRLQISRHVFQKLSFSSSNCVPWRAHSRQACSTPRKKPATCRRVWSFRTAKNSRTRPSCFSSRAIVSIDP